MASRDDRAREIQDTIRRILLAQWDPIGVKDEPGAKDEYDAYIGGVYRLLARGAEASEIAQYLAHIEATDMGLHPSRPGALEHVIASLQAVDVSLGAS